MRNIIVPLAVFIASQLAYGEYTRRTGPFAYFQANYGTRDFSEMNKIIDRFFAVPKTVDGASAFLEEAKFKCRVNEHIPAPRASLGTLKTEEYTSLHCNYQFGGWLPYPDIWFISAEFGKEGLSDFLMQQRMAN